MNFLTLIFVVAFLAITPLFLAVLFYIYRKFYCHKFFKRICLPGPDPHWLYGNLHQLKDASRRHLVVHEWTKKYGPFFGYYEGATPVIVVTRLDAVEQICVRQFWNFQGHHVGPIQPDPETDMDKRSIFHVDVLFAWGTHWKRLRRSINPGFSDRKVKNLTSLMNKRQSELMAIFEKKAQKGEAFTISEQFSCLTIGVISELAFGLKLDNLSGEKSKDKSANRALSIVHKVLKLLQERSPILKAVVVLPEVAPVLKRVIVYLAEHGSGPMAVWNEWNQLCREMVEQRIRNNKNHDDILQNLIDSSSLNFDEIVAQSMALLIGGTETTATALGFLAYLLATHQDVQEKLFEEISKINCVIDEGNYDKLLDLPYLDWVVKESLRIFPISARFLTRYVMEDAQVCGVTIPKSRESSGLFVMVDVYSIHFDPELWGPIDPTKFYPERFSPNYSTNRPDAAFLAFGCGPRFCAGMRLALLEIKLTLANLIRRFRLVEPDEGYPKTGLPVIVEVILEPKNGVPVKLIAR